MTKQIELPSGRYLLVKVPIGSSLHCFEYGNNQAIRYYPKNYNNLDDSRRIELPPNQTYTLIGKADQLTQSQWKEIIEMYTYSGRSSYRAIAW